MGCIGKDFVLHNPRVLLRFFWNASTQQLAGAVHWNEEAEGPPKGAHGASIALVFDEILAYPVWRSGYAAFTANLSLNLRRMVPLLSTLRFVSSITEKKGRKIFVSGKITSGDQTVTFADGTGLWIESAYLANVQGVDATGTKKNGDTDTKAIRPASPAVQLSSKL
jgi:acyl-coenzyme A thioesterase PaaI-like protein